MVCNACCLQTKAWLFAAKTAHEMQCMLPGMTCLAASVAKTSQCMQCKTLEQQPCQPSIISLALCNSCLSTTSGSSPYLIVLWWEVGDKGLGVVSVSAVDVAQHDGLVKGLSCCNLAVMAPKVQVLACNPDVAFPLLRSLVLPYAMVAGGLSLQTLLFTPADAYSDLVLDWLACNSTPLRCIVGH